jgi:hypothetical protein
MLKRHAILWATLLIVVAHTAFAKSHKPPEPQPQSKSSQLPADNGTHQPAPPINFPTPQQITEAITSGIERSEKKYEENHPAPPPDNAAWLNFFLTGCLVAVGAAQCYLIFWTLKATQIAADAAKLSVQSAIALQLPIIRVKPDSLGHGDSHDGETVTEHCLVPVLTFFNLGPTKAFPVEIRCGWTLGEKLPEEPIFLVTETFLPNIIFEPDPKAEPRKFLRFNMPLRAGEWPLICGGKLPLWFYCVFGYDDFMATRHDARFCWRWQNIGFGMGWRVDDTPAYNRKT